MKNKKFREAIRQAQEAVKAANAALDNAMQELGDDEMDAVAGGDNPFSTSPRIDTKDYDDDLRRVASDLTPRPFSGGGTLSGSGSGIDVEVPGGGSSSSLNPLGKR